MNDDLVQTIVNDDHRRFLLDLEFVQTLANPKYLNFLAQRNYFKNPAFINYLNYLRYFKKSEYIKHIRYPQCLYFLDLLQHEQFRQELVQENYCRYIEDQQLYAWQRLQRRRNQLLTNPTGLSGTTVAPSTANNTTNTASGTSDVSTAQLHMSIHDSSSPTTALILPNVIYPVLEQMEKSGYKDIQTDLRRTFCKLEELYPGFSRSFLQSFLQKEMPSISSNVNMNELTLKLEKDCDKTCYLISPTRHEAEFQELNLRSKTLKAILSRIPEDINEKREFLETIKEIASAIKKTLDSVSNTYQYFKTAEGRQALENEKKEFIKYSKNFSNTLKAYFRDNKRDEVYIAANHLLVQTDYLLRTIKLYCETDTLDECLYPSITQHRTSSSSRYSSGNSHYPQMRQNPSNPLRPASSYETNYN